MSTGWTERLPWFFVFGVLIYMELPFEPDLSTTFTLLGLIILWSGFALYRGWFKTLLVLLAIFGVIGGIGYGGWYAQAVKAPRLEHPMRTTIEGTVIHVETRIRGARVLLKDVKLHDGPELSYARIYFPEHVVTPLPGDRIRTWASMTPLPRPVHPQAYNMPRRSWFEQLGALGFTYSTWEKSAYPPQQTILIRLQNWRERLKTSIRSYFAANDPRAEVAVALITGDKGGIQQQVLDAYRGAGMAHILAISGLHMSLLAGFAFMLVRRGLSLFPAIALRYPIKKWAAFLALLFTAAYLSLSGASVPTQRAFIMTSIALCAVILERSPFSMRLVGLAAVCVVLWTPQAVVGASFQMSFAAVIALIATYQGQTRPRWFFTMKPWLRWCVFYCFGIVLTTFIASAATAPIAWQHFGRVATYAIPANLLALPVFGLWVMPWAMVATALLPFDAAAFPLACMAEGIGFVTAVADYAVSWYYAIVSFPKMTQLGYMACLLGGVMLAVLAGRLRLLGLGMLVLGLSTAWWQDRPDVMIADQGQSIAVLQGEGYALKTQGRSTFLTDVWASSTASTMDRKNGWSCDASGCVAKSEGGWFVARSETPGTLVSDCTRTKLVLTQYPVTRTQRARCGNTPILDINDLENMGAVTIWFDGNGSIKRTNSTASQQGCRHWRQDVSTCE